MITSIEWIIKRFDDPLRMLSILCAVLREPLS